MSVKTSTTANHQRAVLDGLPEIRFPDNLRLALGSGRRLASILREVITLRRGPGKLSPQEYFYYRLWDPDLPIEQKRRFVGKQAQHPMHLACNDRAWYAVVNDKLLFQQAMAGAGLPVPALRAVIHPFRNCDGAQALRSAADVSGFFGNPSAYPWFGKPIDGKYSLDVISGDRFDAATNTIVGHRGAGQQIPDLLAQIETHPGFLIQERLRPPAAIATRFGEQLWSLRLLVILTPNGPRISRAVAKIATGDNVADNYWRAGNLLGAVNPDTGRICRTVTGSGEALTIDPSHPDTGGPITGTELPDWPALVDLAKRAAWTLPGVRTQAWDIAVTDRGPVLLEVNFGGDLNLAQLAWGRGVLDPEFRAHLLQCGYRL
jgi:hypothetical protein